MRISIIAALAENDVIGRDGMLPWRLSSDLARFKQLTMGHAIIMGRKTWESIGRPLPGRRTIVVTRQADYPAAGVDVVSSLEDALAIARATGVANAFVIGGAEIYRLALACSDRLYLTRVHAKIDGDTVFPPVEWNEWRKISSEQHAADEKNEFPYSFQVYEREAPQSPR